MTPVNLNPPPSSFELKEEQRSQLFLSPASLSDQRYNFGKFWHSHHHDHRQVHEYTSESRLSDRKRPSSSSSSFEGGINDTREYGEGSAKWVPLKMRLMRRMMNSNSNSSSSSNTDNKPVKCTVRFQDHQQQFHANGNSNTNHIITRICSDCNTTTTPLWRSGPKGPKSLCNACGIRQRKARRAMAAMANGRDVAMETPTTKSSKVQKKEKKLRIGHVTQCKKLCKPLDPPPQTQNTKLCFKNFALSSLPRVFPSDVEEAAVLLMELSCGFVHG